MQMFYVQTTVKRLTDKCFAEKMRPTEKKSKPTKWCVVSNMGKDEKSSVLLYVVQPKSSRNLNAARKPLVVQLWASRYRELYPL
jgi:hypothetical protein